MSEERDSPSQRAKILVADDDMNVRLLSRQCLEAEGMLVIEAADGHEALNAFVRERPDLICGIDLHISGYKVAWNLQEPLEELEEEFVRSLNEVITLESGVEVSPSA